MSGPPKKSRLNDMLDNPTDTSGAMDLFRDRRPISHDSEGERDDTSEPVEADDITPDALREALLCSIGAIRNRARSGRAFPSDAGSLEKLMELVLDFPQLAKALDDVQSHKVKQEALRAPKRTGSTSDLVKRLRVATGKPDGGGTGGGTPGGA